MEDKLKMERMPAGQSNFQQNQNHHSQQNYHPNHIQSTPTDKHNFVLQNSNNNAAAKNIMNVSYQTLHPVYQNRQEYQTQNQNEKGQNHPQSQQHSISSISPQLNSTSSSHDPNGQVYQGYSQFQGSNSSGMGGYQQQNAPIRRNANTDKDSSSNTYLNYTQISYPGTMTNSHNAQQQQQPVILQSSLPDIENENIQKLQNQNVFVVANNASTIPKHNDITDISTSRTLDSHNTTKRQDNMNGDNNNRIRDMETQSHHQQQQQVYHISVPSAASKTTPQYVVLSDSISGGSQLHTLPSGKESINGESGAVYAFNNTQPMPAQLALVEVSPGTYSQVVIQGSGPLTTGNIHTNPNLHQQQQVQIDKQNLAPSYNVQYQIIQPNGTTQHAYSGHPVIVESTTHSNYSEAPSHMQSSTQQNQHMPNFASSQVHHSSIPNRPHHQQPNGSTVNDIDGGQKESGSLSCSSLSSSSVNICNNSNTETMGMPSGGIPPQKIKKTRNRRQKLECDFLKCLVAMIEAEDDSIIQHDQASNLLRINCSPTHLADHVLHKYYTHSNFTSFQRQLNYFGFKKVEGKGLRSPCAYRIPPPKNATDHVSLSSLLRIPRKSKKHEKMKKMLEAESAYPGGGVGMVYPHVIWAPEQQYMQSIGQPQSQQINVTNPQPISVYHYPDKQHHQTTYIGNQVQQEGVEERKAGNDTPYYATYSK